MHVTVTRSVLQPLPSWMPVATSLAWLFLSTEWTWLIPNPLGRETKDQVSVGTEPPSHF